MAAAVLWFMREATADYDSSGGGMVGWLSAAAASARCVKPLPILPRVCCGCRSLAKRSDFPFAAAATSASQTLVSAADAAGDR